MSCNCGSGRAKHASKFGTCAFCVHVTVAGFVCSWLLLSPFVFVQIPLRLLAVLALPAAFFTVWLALHWLGFRPHRHEPS